MSAKSLRRLADVGICFLCRRRLSERGQRGRRRTHYICRKWSDAGYSVDQIRRLAQAESSR